MRRRIEHGTTNKSRVPINTIKQMKIEFDNGMSLRSIGRKFGYTHSTVGRVLGV